MTCVRDSGLDHTKPPAGCTSRSIARRGTYHGFTDCASTDQVRKALRCGCGRPRRARSKATTADTHTPTNPMSPIYSCSHRHSPHLWSGMPHLATWYVPLRSCSCAAVSAPLAPSSPSQTASNRLTLAIGTGLEGGAPRLFGVKVGRPTIAMLRTDFWAERAPCSRVAGRLLPAPCSLLPTSAAPCSAVVVVVVVGGGGGGWGGVRAGAWGSERRGSARGGSGG